MCSFRFLFFAQGPRGRQKPRAKSQDESQDIEWWRGERRGKDVRYVVLRSVCTTE